MATDHRRLVVCLFVGAAVGLPLGTLLVPDPTGALAAGAALAATVLVAGGLYLSGWLAAE